MFGNSAAIKHRQTDRQGGVDKGPKLVDSRFLYVVFCTCLNFPVLFSVDVAVHCEGSPMARGSFYGRKATDAERRC